MTFLRRVLAEPRYGFEKDGRLVVPSHREIFREFLYTLNIFRTRKNWLALLGWSLSLSLAIPLAIFLTKYFSWPLFIAGFIYSMVFMGSHGTLWLHRYSTHRAYRFKYAWFRELTRNLVIKVIPEEIYVVSHHVHHRYSEKPGDPYNIHGGWLYCFLADATHQGINRNLDEKDYATACKLMEHTGVHLNSYAQYQKWGTLCHPGYTVMHYALNWGFWFGAFYLLGGMPFAIAIFGMAGVWAIGVRTYNYDGHGRGKDRRREGSDFNREDFSVNQAWPGIVASEWHNNHHLYPRSARCGFLPSQPDMVWGFIRTARALGLVDSCRDSKPEFYRDHYLPYLEAKKAKVAATESRTEPTLNLS